MDKQGKVGQRYLASISAVIILIVTVILVVQDATTTEYTWESLWVSLVCLGLFTLSDRAGYRYLATIVAWLVVGLPGSLVVVLVGAFLAALVRTQGIPEVFSTRQIIDTLVERVVVAGLTVLSAAALFALLGGEIEPVPLGVSLLVGYAVMQGVTYFLFVPYNAILRELVLILLIPVLVVIHQDSGVVVFTAIMALVAAQEVRYRQVNHAQQVLERRVHELSLLNGVGQNISANLMLDDVLLSVNDWVAQLIDHRRFFIGLYDDQRQMMRYPLTMDHDRSIAWPDEHTDQRLLLKRIVEDRVMLHVRRMDNSDLARDVFDNLPDYEAFLGLPLMAGARLVGVMGIYAHDSLQHVEMGTLETIANSASLAIRNAMLYERSVQLAENLNRINQSVQDVMFNLDSEDAMQAACESAIMISGAQKAVIFLPDEQDKSITSMVKSVGLTPEHEALYASPVYRPSIHDDSPFFVSDVALLDERNILRELAQVGGFQALAEIPLKSGNMMVGLMVVFHDGPHQYHETEIELLETLAYQVAAALDNAELLGVLEQYASEQAQLVQLSRISTSSLQLETVIASVSMMLQQMMRVEQVRIGVFATGLEQMHLYSTDAQNMEVVPVQQVPEFAGLRHPVQPGPQTYWQHEDQISGALQQYLDAEMVVLVPLIANNDLLGVTLMVDSSPREFNDNDLRLMELATNQIATQLHNIQLFHFTQEALDRRLQQLALIENLARQITSALDLDRLIRHVLEAAVRATQSEVAVLGLLTDRGDVRAIVLEQHGGEWVHYEAVQDRSIGLMGQVLETGEMLVIADNRTMPRYASSLYQDDNQQYRSSLVVPLRDENDVIGVVTVESQYPDYFKDEHVEFINNLAGHAVISIQNAQLLQERQTQIETLTRLRELSLHISATTDKEAVATEVSKTALDLVQGQYAAFFFGSSMTRLAGLERTESGYEDVALELPAAVLNEVARTGEIIVVDQQDYVVVPIKYGSSIRAVMCVAGPYTKSILNTLQLLAIQASGHLENAILYEQIRAGNNRMRAILDSTRDGIILLDRDGKLIEANLSAENLLNIPLEEHINEYFVDLLMDHLATEVAEDAMYDSLQEMARTLRLEPQRITTRSMEIPKDGKPRYIDEVGSPVMDGQGRIFGRLLTLRDVTEERLLAAYRDEISSMVVHDLRGPLGSIITSLTLAMEVAEEIGDETIPQLLEVSLDTSHTLLALVDSLLDIARLETRRMPLKQSPAVLADLVDGAYRTLESVFQEAGIVFKTDIPADLPPVNVDHDKIRRVMINILDNAARFTPTGEPVMVSAERIDRQHVLVRISDSGPGIPPDEAERIFEKFRQVKGNVPSRGRKGSGLGLTFCKLAVEAHGERIWVDRNGPLPGASFAFTLPVSLTT